MYNVIHLAETDGDILVRTYATIVEVQEYLKQANLPKEDYIVILGNIIEM